MGWETGYLPGSFRGVPFRTASVRSSGGRRLVEHIFPERDDSVFEDLGRRNASFSFSAYVIGDDYFEQRQKLVKALDTPGPGKLIHPYWGDVLVQVDTWNCIEDTNEGRVARFDLTMHKAGEAKLTLVGPSAIDKLKDTKKNFLDAALETLVEVYDVVSRPTAVLQDAINIGNKVLNVVDQAKKITGVYEEYQAKLSALKGQFVELALLSRAMGEDLIDLISFGTDAASPVTAAIAIGDQAKTQYDELKAITDVQDSSLSQFPSLASELGYPGMEIQKFVSRVALGNKAGLVGEMTLSNNAQALGILREIGGLVQRIEGEEGVTDGLYETARELRYNVAEVIRERLLTLDSLVSIELPEFEPSLVLAWQQFGDISREKEIVELNRVLNPGFVPGNKPILVPK
jgi:prophage DNA circulation protein